MDVHMSQDVLAGLERARKQAAKDSGRLRVMVGDEVYPVLRAWDGGFALAADDAPHLRGEVLFCDGANVLHECLIICSALEGRDRVYEYKRRTRATSHAPVDYVIAPDAPIALLTK